MIERMESATSRIAVRRSSIASGGVSCHRFAISARMRLSSISGTARPGSAPLASGHELRPRSKSTTTGAWSLRPLALAGVAVDERRSSSARPAASVASTRSMRMPLPLWKLPAR